jgi:hypothetical protein
MNAVFTALVLAGLAVGLVCVPSAIYLLFKRFAQNTTEVEIGHFGKIKTAESGLVLAFLGIFLFVYSTSSYNRAKRGDELQSGLNSLMINTARKLHTEFHNVIDGKRPPLKPEEFSRVDLFIKLLKEMDSSNGHAYYFTGEAYRWMGQIEPAQSTFYKYLETLSTLSEDERGGSTDQSVCFQRPSGYCRQRTAWIHHELANDFYKTAESTNDPIERLDRLRTTLTQAEAAITDFPPKGFEQPIATAALISKVKKEIASLEKSAEAPP